MKANQDIQISIEITDKIVISGPYSTSNNNLYRAIGAKWDKTHSAWIVSKARLLEIDRLFGTDSSVVTVRVPYAQLSAINEAVGSNSVGGQLQMGGYVLASRYSRDRRADLYAELVAGTIPASGGSVKHPRVKASDDSVFELNVRRAFAEAHGLEIIEDTPKAGRHISQVPILISEDGEVPPTFEGVPCE